MLRQMEADKPGGACDENSRDWLVQEIWPYLENRPGLQSTGQVACPAIGANSRAPIAICVVAAGLRAGDARCCRTPPIIPTPITYSQPCVKSNRWELNAPERIFCATIRRPSQENLPASANSARWASHIANRSAIPR